MPKKSRKISSTSIYHIMCRGNNKSDIFFENDDYFYFIDILKDLKQNYNFFIYSYCLMKNHVHLLIEFKDNSISVIMHKLNVIYAIYINKVYGRVGHLFQGRFRSEPVENDNYLLTVVRYIHNNPVKAEIVKNSQDYKWSSYREYVDVEETSSLRRAEGSWSPRHRLTDTAFILDYFGNNIKGFIEFSLMNNSDNILDVKENKKIEILTIVHAKRYINDFIKTNKSDFYNSKLIKELKIKSAFSNVLIGNLLGISEKSVRRALLR